MSTVSDQKEGLEPSQPVNGDNNMAHVNDDEQLARLGHKQELKRNHTRLSMLGLAFAILNSWTALSASLSVALPSGGPSAVLWGLVASGICNVCLSSSLAEFLSAYPTAGGQYHWVAMISPQRWVPLLSWICGWFNVAGWVFLVGTGSSLAATLILGMASLTHPNYEVQPFHTYLVYVAMTLLAFLINAFLNRLLPIFNKAAFIWSVLGWFVICMVTIICARPDYQPGTFVFGGNINQTGWPNGFAWLLGLLQGAFGLTGFDSVAHMIEEIPNPSRQAPRIMIEAVLIGTGTGFIFLMILLFAASDIDAAISAGEGPLLAILYQATGSKAGSVVLTVFPVVCLLFATTGIMTTASRMVYAFARDQGLPAHSWLSQVNTGLDVPLNALIITTVSVIIYGVLYFASSLALNAILSASVVALSVSYGFPVAINMLRGRKMLPKDRPFALRGALGWIMNSVGLAFVALTTVLFLFPSDADVNSGNMNYTIVAFGCVMVISFVDYIFEGRKRFHGPKIEIEGEVPVHDEIKAAEGMEKVE